MGDAYKGLTIKLGADDTKLTAALKKARTSASGVSKELKAIERALKFNPGNVRLLAQQQEDLKRKVSSTTEELRLLKQAESEIGRENMSNEQWIKLQSDIAMAEHQLEAYKRQLAECQIQQNLANSKLNQFGTHLADAAPKMKNFGSGVESVGQSLSRTVTPALLATGGAAIAAAVNIDTSLTNVKKTVNGTDEQYQKLKQSAIEFSKTNAVSASQILDIQALGAQLGFAIDELDEFGRVVSGLDIATNMNAEQAATEMAQFANITKMSHGEISNYGSAIVGLGNSFATTESDISSMAMRLAAAGTQVGMSQADILGLATALSSMGVEAEAGGTAISTVMAQIDKDIATNSSAVETWASAAGKSAREFADAWRNDPVSALSDLLAGMENATEEGGNMSVMLEDLGIDAVRQVDIMKRLAGNSELVGQAVAKSNEEWQKNTALQAEVDNRNDSLAAKFEILKNRVIAVAEQVGTPLANAALEFVDAAEPMLEVVSDAAEAFADMDEEDQRMIAGLLAATAALGPMLSATGKVVQGIGGITEVAGKASKGIARFSAECEVMGKKAKLAEVGTSALHTALKGFAAIVAVEALIALAGAVKDAVRYENDMAKATDGLKDALSGSGRVSADAAAGIEAIGSCAGPAAKSVRELADSQARWVDALVERNREVYEGTSALDGYRATIEGLAGKSSLTAEEQAELRLAIDGVNEACGTSYEVAQNAGGAYVVMSEGAEVAKGEIYGLIDAQKAQLELDASSESYTEALKQQEECARTLASEQQRLSDTQKSYGDMLADGTITLDQYSVATGIIEGSVKDAQAAYDAASGAVDAYSEKMTLAKIAAEGLDGGQAGVITNSKLLQQTILNSGQSLTGFRGSLEACGLSTEALGAVTEDQWVKIAQSYDGSTASVIAAMDNLGIEVPQAAREAAAQAAAATAEETPHVVGSFAQMKDGVLQVWDEATGTFVNATRESVQGAQGVLTNAVPGMTDATVAIVNGVTYALDPVTGNFTAISDSAVSGFNGNLAAGAGGAAASAGSIKSSAIGGVSGVDSSLGNTGTAASGSFSRGIASGIGPTAGNAASIASAARGMGNVGDTYSYGSHAGYNFASGISSAIGAVAAAAASLANRVKGILGHTVPKEGPLRNGGKGEAEWGAHSVQNYIEGMESQIPRLRRVSQEMARVPASALSGIPGMPDFGMRPGSAGSAGGTANTVNTTNSYSITINAKEGIGSLDALIRQVELAARANPARSGRR